ncbi:hypothetical protein H072_5521 [Dactylellina haptotyla CBS 200.50]|uniref:Inner centromere protein ARK-binding domain-containing protein n=1 Tax=Dactylellina haptotyla (strain CBS 200.50) TaxID=1284197 RepID=S8BMA9_DACHA|nr:hypothetical protein H072_5521 [Dactylellina haptotyla CBS 200.50]
MASKIALPDVGSPQWILDELSDAHRKETDHFEDFTIAIRNELEWLNEHMADIFTQSTKIDITELYKTPGKLRGKTPRNPRKGLRVGAQDNNAPIAAVVENSIRGDPEGIILRPESGLSSQKHLGSIASIPDLVRDSGAWSRSSASASLSGSFDILPCAPIERTSPAKKPSYKNAPDVIAETAERRTFSDATRRSFMSAQEEQIDEHYIQSAPSGAEIHPGNDVKLPWNTGNQNPLNRHDVDITVESVRLVNYPEPRTNSADASLPHLPRAKSLRTTPKTVPYLIETPSRQSSVSPIQMSSPIMPSSPISPIPQQSERQPVLTPKPAPIEQTAESETPSEAASPAGIARSSMNFASLPARETLTHKKSMGGANTTGSRNSHAEDRTSFFGRLTGGKSLGTASILVDLTSHEANNISSTNHTQPTPHNLSDEDDDDDDLNEQLRLAEINKASVMQLSEKTSTQRLNEKISQLSQQGTNRLSKSTSASWLSLSAQNDECNSLKYSTVTEIKTPNTSDTPTLGLRESLQSEEGDWIPSRPQLMMSHKTPSETMTMTSVESSIEHPESPSPLTPKMVALTSTTKLPILVSTSKKYKDGSVVYPLLPASASPEEARTPLKTKPSGDLEVSTAKKNQANIFSLAKQLLWRSGRSESPKPPPQFPSNSSQKPSEGPPPENKLTPNRVPNAEHSQQAFYPGVRSILPHEQPLPTLGKISDQPSSSRPLSQIKNYQLERDGHLVVYGDILKREVQLNGPSSAIMDGIDLITEDADDFLRSPDVSTNEPSLPNSPFSAGDASSGVDGEFQGSKLSNIPRTVGPNIKESRNLSPQPTKSTPPTSASFKESRSQNSPQSKGSELKKPNRGLFGVKDSGISKPKAPSTNIRLVTASQRETDNRKNGHASSATLVSALTETFGPSKEPNPRPPSSMSTSSTQSFQAPKSKSIAALNSAAKAHKREQEERERKAAQKQENERRRQENLKREEARREEERKQQALKSNKKHLTKMSDDDDTRKRLPGTSKGLQPLLQSSKLLSKATTFSQKGPLGSSKSQQDPKRQPKRFLPEEDGRVPGDDKGHKDVINQQTKRRKTEDVSETPVPSTFAPPIRQSTARKENLPPSKIGGIFSQDYTPAPNTHMQFNQGSSLAKTTLPPPQQLKSNNSLPQVDAVKYSHDKLKFGTMVTPSAPRTGRLPPTISRESPIYPNPESIELPEIHTDSEDDEGDKSFRVPKWADSPELRQALQDQLGIDPETIFGPIAPLSMEDIFRGRTDRAKFRARTSSANWSGADRLTAAEIEADRIERQRILENGGWTYQKAQ